MAEIKEYYAKSPREDGSRETVGEHCRKVSKLAAVYGSEFGQGDEAALCGLFHDFGKYSKDFQDVLSGTKTGVDHAVCGGTVLTLLSKLIGRKNISPVYQAAIEAVNAHHSSLKPYYELKGYINDNFKNEDPVVCNDGKASALSGKDKYEKALHAFVLDFPKWKSHFKKFSFILEDKNKTVEYYVKKMMYTRMLFSCLVDADYTVSSEKEPEVLELKPEVILNNLNTYMENLRKTSDSDSELNDIRNKLFEACGTAGENRGSGLFTLTAPTGTGKTLALLNFALHHCIKNKKKRIILALPFLSLTEQTAAAYSSIVPDILQDHSQSSLDEAAREHAAKWDAPFIITTSVKFYEALFADKPTDCRKLHNIANSVIIFDEAQSLPSHLTRATIYAVKELCEHYGRTIVFSTATQPKFDTIENVEWKLTEIMPDNAFMFKALKRTDVKWSVDKPTALEDVAEDAAKSNNSCIIVNLRAHARKTYEAIKELSGREGTYFLTTDLCPDHRSDIIAEIKERQKAGLCCRVVSTQCIEAGVDLDFETLFRALAPLEAVIQAAGRCNRNGKLKSGEVTVFEPEEEGRLYPDDWYGTGAGRVKVLLSRSQKNELDINDPSVTENYYELLFEKQNDSKKLTDAIMGTDYKATEKEYKLINNKGFKALVPYKKQMAFYEELRSEPLEDGIDAAWLKKAAPITVNTFENLENSGYPVEYLYYREKGHKGKTSSDVYILNTGAESQYTDSMGLQFQSQNSKNYFF